MGILDFIGDILTDDGSGRYETGYKHGSDPNGHRNGNFTTGFGSDYYNKGYNDGYYDRQKIKYALTCRKCGKDALPVKGTPRHYNCACGHKFTGAKHPF